MGDYDTMAPVAEGGGMGAVSEQLSPERARRMAAHRNRNAAKRAPLFAHAGLLPEWTADQVIAQHGAFQERRVELDRQESQKTAAMRAVVVDIVGEEAVAHWDAYTAGVYPPHPEYVQGYYREQYRKWRGCQTHCIWCADECPLSCGQRRSDDPLRC
jgi:hypothetical protein